LKTTPEIAPGEIVPVCLQNHHQSHKQLALKSSSKLQNVAKAAVNRVSNRAKIGGIVAKNCSCCRWLVRGWYFVKSLQLCSLFPPYLPRQSIRFKLIISNFAETRMISIRRQNAQSFSPGRSAPNQWQWRASTSSSSPCLTIFLGWAVPSKSGLEAALFRRSLLTAVSSESALEGALGRQPPVPTGFTRRGAAQISIFTKSHGRFFATNHFLLAVAPPINGSGAPGYRGNRPRRTRWSCPLGGQTSGTRPDYQVLAQQSKIYWHHLTSNGLYYATPDRRLRRHLLQLCRSL